MVLHTLIQMDNYLTTHLHIYQEGFDDKWAYPIDPELFHDLDNAGFAFEDFCRFCHIGGIPPYQEVLF